ncbi:MAG: hypothetical protein IJC57_00675 [Clostridia bacterium]|nr:hypothetical protein [Clostridia bacterium]
MNFKKLKKSLVAVVFALSFCFSGVVNVISALEDRYYALIANQLVGNQAALANLQLIRAWHDRHPLDNPAHAKDFVVGKIQSRFQTFADENQLPECDWKSWNHDLEALGKTLIFAVEPDTNTQYNFVGEMVSLCTKLSTQRILDCINNWDEEISWIGRISGDATLTTADL